VIEIEADKEIKIGFSLKKGARFVSIE